MNAKVSRDTPAVVAVIEIKIIFSTPAIVLARIGIAE